MGQDLPISLLPSLTAATNNSLIPIVNGGVTYEMTIQNLWKSQPFATMYQDWIPDTDNSYQIGDLSNSLKSIYTNAIVLSGNTISGITNENLLIIPGNGDMFVNGNILPFFSGNSLGSNAHPWSDVILGNASLKILPDAPSGNTVTLSNLYNFLRVQSGGLIVEGISGQTVDLGVFRVDPNGQVFITSSYQNPNNASVFEIIGNDGGYSAPPVNPGGMIHVTGHDNQVSRIVNDSYGDTRFSQFGGRHAGGTAQFPTPTKQGTIARFAGVGWTTASGFGNVGDLPHTFMDMYSLGTFSATSTPTEFRFYATKPNEYQGSLSFKINPSGITLTQSGSTITFGDNTIQQTAYLGTATTSQIGGVKPDNVTIGITGGTIGIIGGAGTSGTSGTGGTNGTSGTNGSSGINGTSGTNGTNGTSGTNGSSGINGTSGTSPTGTTGYYGAFTSNVTQTNPVANVARAFSADTTEINNGVILSANTRFVVQNAGVYNIQFSTQLQQLNNTDSAISIWFRKNGTDIPRSNTELSIDKNQGGTSKLVAAWNIVESFTANQYIEIMWSSPDTGMEILWETAKTGPTRPVTPSLIVTITQV